MDYILYHKNCQDGWCAAYICKKKWPDAQLLPLSYGLTQGELDMVFECVFQKDVIMVDYSFPNRELMEELARVTRYLKVYDHHASKKDVLAGFNFAVFDNERSGAGLAWDHIFGKDSHSFEFTNGGSVVQRPRPWWVNYTEDQDLWKWKLPDGRIINSFLMIQPRTIEAWQKIERMQVSEAIQIGTGAKQNTDFTVRSLMGTVQLGRFMGYRVGIVNTSVAVSEVGEAIYNLLSEEPLYPGKAYDLAMTWYERAKGDVSFGLRSLTVDCGVLAKAYGGGGHKNSAGFEMSLTEARDLLDRILSRGAYAPITYRG